ncbi:serine-rich adhesin for platelets-like [Argopecten irradians]|uniref:serine-rich adhesin for platelets-like n=1 Tax=Argopecten irradians TaxID=31199 RepID=UPI00371C8BF2
MSMDTIWVIILVVGHLCVTKGLHSGRSIPSDTDCPLVYMCPTFCLKTSGECFICDCGESLTTFMRKASDRMQDDYKAIFQTGSQFTNGQINGGNQKSAASGNKAGPFSANGMMGGNNWIGAGSASDKSHQWIDGTNHMIGQDQQWNEGQGSIGVVNQGKLAPMMTSYMQPNFQEFYRPMFGVMPGRCQKPDKNCPAECWKINGFTGCMYCACQLTTAPGPSMDKPNIDHTTYEINPTNPSAITHKMTQSSHMQSEESTSVPMSSEMASPASSGLTSQFSTPPVTTPVTSSNSIYTTEMTSYTEKSSSSEPVTNTYSTSQEMTSLTTPTIASSPETNTTSEPVSTKSFHDESTVSRNTQTLQLMLASTQPSVKMEMTSSYQDKTSQKITSTLWNSLSTPSPSLSPTSSHESLISDNNEPMTVWSGNKPLNNRTSSGSSGEPQEVVSLWHNTGTNYQTTVSGVTRSSEAKTHRFDTMLEFFQEMDAGEKDKAMALLQKFFANVKPTGNTGSESGNVEIGEGRQPSPAGLIDLDLCPEEKSECTNRACHVYDPLRQCTVCMCGDGGEPVPTAFHTETTLGQPDIRPICRPIPDNCPDECLYLDATNYYCPMCRCEQPDLIRKGSVTMDTIDMCRPLDKDCQDGCEGFDTKTFCPKCKC